VPRKVLGTQICGKYTLTDHISYDGITRPSQLFKGIDNNKNHTVFVQALSLPDLVKNPVMLSIWKPDTNALKDLSHQKEYQGMFLPVIDTGIDDSIFYSVYNADGYEPLIAATPTFLSSPLPEYRKLLWINAQVLVKVQNSLNKKGLVSKYIASTSIFLHRDSQASIKLGCFEDLRNMGALEYPNIDEKPQEDNHNQGIVQNRILLRDLLLNWLTPIIGKHVNTEEINGIELGINKFEYALFSELKRPLSTSPKWLNLSWLIDKIQEIILVLTTNPELYFVFNSHSKKALSKLITENNYSEDNDDFDSNDLGHILQDGVLIRCENEKHQFYILIKNAVIGLKQYPGAKWLVSQFEAVRKSPATRNILNKISLSRTDVSIFHTNTISNNIQKQFAGATSLMNLLPITDEAVIPAAQTELFTGFTFLFAMLELIKDLTKWPIKIIQRDSSDYGVNIYETKFDLSRYDTDLARKLGILRSASPNDHLRNLLVDYANEGSTGWFVVPNSNGIKYEWHYLSTNSETGNFIFEGNSDFYEGDQLELIQPEGANDRQLEQQAKLLSALATRSELLETLAEPSNSIRESYDEKISIDEELDDSKLKALKRICATTPLFCLQGPPGVGKTYLVKELVSKYLNVNPNLKFLVAAQGHSPLNNLVNELSTHYASIKFKQQPLIVNLSRDEVQGATELYSVVNQAKILLQQVDKSPLFGKCPEHIRSQIIECQEGTKNVKWTERLPNVGIYDLLVRSANILCSTTNSKTLSNLVHRQIRFDWSVVEEAGRANGIELLSPLLLAPRVLLIGDPRQLPSFTESEVQRLIGDEQLFQEVKKAIFSNKSKTLTDPFKHFLEMSFNSTFEQSIPRATESALHLFKALFEQGMEKKKLNRSSSAVLNIQYRMHPKIAEWVSTLFYADIQLETSDETKLKRRFSERPYGYIKTGKRWLPAAPFVFISLPFGQKVMARTSETRERGGIYNASEIEVLIEVLCQLKLNKSGEISIAILTPYNLQIKKIRLRLNQEKNGRLASLWETVKDLDKRIFTIDAFQGSEADIVIASLVRNNHAPNANFTQMGIVKDSRRINVLMSRAKWKLIVISSLDYLNARFIPGNELPEQDKMKFLQVLTSELSRIREIPDSRFPKNHYCNSTETAVYDYN
jgi:superfamily I DNA and/or RNA helicase